MMCSVTCAQDLLLPVKDDGRRQVDGHQRRPSQKEVVESDNITVVGEDVAEPGDQPGQGEHGAQLRVHQVGVEVGAGLLDDRVDELQQLHGLLHAGRHELPEVTDGESLHDLIAEVLPHHQEEGDGHVVVALVVVEAGLSYQHSHYQPGELLLQCRPLGLLDTRGESLQTPVDVQNN